MAAPSVRVWAAEQLSHSEKNEPGRPQRSREGGKVSSGKPPLPRKPNGLTIPQPSTPQIELSNVSLSLSPRFQGCVTTAFSFDEVACRRRIEEVWPQKCAYIVMEIIHTERVYVEALADVIKGYITPLYSYLLDSGQGPAFLQTVFSNIIKVYLTNLGLLEQLQNKCTDPHELGQVFVKTDFSQYTHYCANYSKGNACLEKSMAEDAKLREFLDSCQILLGHSLPLDSMLIKPVQRILKYPLLLGAIGGVEQESSQLPRWPKNENLCDHYGPPTSAENSGYNSIQVALEVMISVADQINGSMKQPGKSLPLAMSPALTARRRSKEVKDLQASRKMKSSKVRLTPSLEHHSNHHTTNCTVSDPMPFIHPQLATTNSTMATALPKQSDRTLGIHRSLERLQQLEKDQERERERNRSSVSMKRGPGSMPCVSELRDYFESLSTQSAPEDERCRGSSLSPRVTPKQSPIARRRGLDGSGGLKSESHRPRSSHFSLSRRNSVTTLDRVTAELRRRMKLSPRSSATASTAL